MLPISVLPSPFKHIPSDSLQSGIDHHYHVNRYIESGDGNHRPPREILKFESVIKARDIIGKED